MVDYLKLMAVGYALTVLVETAVLWVGLSARHAPRVRLFAGLWLTACTYPVVWLVLPAFFADRTLYLIVAETFAPVAECVIFWAAFVRGQPANRAATVRDLVAITLANLASFGVGELLKELEWWTA